MGNERADWTLLNIEKFKKLVIVRCETERQIDWENVFVFKLFSENKSDQFFFNLKLSILPKNN